MHAMAIEESDREDLLGQAVQMPLRILIEIAALDSNATNATTLDADPIANPDPVAGEEGIAEIARLQIFVGRRKTGGVSIYIDEDPVYQFTESGKLRRAFVSGKKYAAHLGKLCPITRTTQGGRVALVWQQLDDQQFVDFQEMWSRYLLHLMNAVISGSYKIMGQVPENEGLPAWFSAWLETAPTELIIAEKPNAE
jgi:hypothetical protein